MTLRVGFRIASESFRVDMTEQFLSATPKQAVPLDGKRGAAFKFSFEITNFSPFAPSGSHCLNFKLPIESSTQSQPLQDILLYPRTRV